jgi:hypothetical protein
MIWTLHEAASIDDHVGMQSRQYNQPVYILHALGHVPMILVIDISQHDLDGSSDVVDVVVVPRTENGLVPAFAY